MRNEVWWITGASSGIGRELSKVAAEAGFKIALTARSSKVLEELSSEIKAQGGESFVATGNVCDRDEMKRLSNTIQEKWGQIDVLVANAGTHNPTDVTQFDASDYGRIMELNYLGSLNCIEAVLPAMRKRGRGQLVGVASLAGYRGLPRAAAYGASKAALTHFLESIRFDVAAYGISVTVVSPGFVRTPLTDKNDFPMPFLMEVDAAAQSMFSGIRQVKQEVYFPWQFAWIMKLLRVIPFPIYHWFIRKTVLKG